MKPTKIFNLFIAIAIIGLIITSCKKDEKDIIDDKTFDSSSMQQLSKDEVAIESYSNEALDDANDVLTKGVSKSKSFPCNATIDSVSLTNDTVKAYVITFNGLNCSGNKFKTGQLIIRKNILSHWSQSGTAVSLQFVNFKVAKATNLSQWIMLNGTKVWTNTSGGLIYNLGGSANSIVHTVIGSIEASFNDNTTRTWNISRRKTFTGTYPNDLILSIEGTGSSNGYDNLATWGLNRHSENFYTQINQAVVLKQSCDWKPVSGIKKHQIPSDSKSATITFGFDSSNLPITGNACPTRYKIDFVKGSYSGTLFLDIP